MAEIKVELVSRADIPEGKWRKKGQAALILEQLEGKGIEEAVKVTCVSHKEANKLYQCISNMRRKKGLAIGASRIERILYVYKTGLVIGDRNAD